jgi:PucR C-terminal helix-turn-helix domain/GGDEF-like domain
VNTRPRTSLGRVLDDLGTTLLELVHGDPDLSLDIDGIAIHDRLDESAMPARTLVLGVGVHGPQEISHLLVELGKQDALGLIVRAPVPLDETVAAAAAGSGVAVMGLTRGASWAHVAAMLRSLLAEGDIGVAVPETLGGMPSGDLFALANAIAALLDAPITIEDRSSRVLAFSGGQEETDPSRVETILGRQVPTRDSRILTRSGVFRELYRSDRPLYVDPPEADLGSFSLPRVAVTVRAGDEVLGSIWAVVSAPLSAELMQAFCDAAKLVALHLLRVRAGADVERRLRTDLLSTALEGGIHAREALTRLGVADHHLVVLALALTEPDDVTHTIAADADLTAERQRVSDAFAMHLSAVHPRSAAALIGDTVYGLLPVTHANTEGEQHAARIAREFVDRVGNRMPVVIAVSPIAFDTPGLAHARASAQRTLRVLSTAGHGKRLVARLDDVQVEALLLDLRDLVVARGDRPTGPVARLLDYDEQHNANLVETLRAWLDAFGDVIAASTAVKVHPNTFRYRLRRLAEVGNLDLADPEARFAAMLQLRVGLGTHPSGRTATDP